jgi:NADH-quinone oxidoreductase subunit F
MGTTISTIVYDIGGGPAGAAKTIKAFEIGGPAGGCIPVGLANIPVDYETLTEVGVSMGAGGLIVLGNNACIVDVAKHYMAFLKDESCGKCFTCRKGTQRMYELLDDISNGVASREQIDLLEELALVVQDSTMCGLGQTAPNPVLSTLRHFREEYLEHIKGQKCPAGVCNVHDASDSLERKIQ